VTKKLVASFPLKLLEKNYFSLYSRKITDLLSARISLKMKKSQSDFAVFFSASKSTILQDNKKNVFFQTEIYFWKIWKEQTHLK
jgi:hypothetical protein